MAARWEASPEFPAGHAVPLTDAELAQRARDEQAAADRAAADADVDSHDRTIRDRLEAALDALEDTAAWSLRTQAERVELLRRVDAGLIRLALRRLEAAE